MPNKAIQLEQGIRDGSELSGRRLGAGLLLSLEEDDASLACHFAHGVGASLFCHDGDLEAP